MSLALIILCVAMFVRTYGLGTMEFRQDSAYWSLEALKVLRDGALPLVGLQVGSVNVELFNGPLASYVVAAAFAVSDNDLVAADIALALTNVVAVALTFALGKRLFTANVGMLAAAWMSIAPWLVLNSRTMWSHALLTPAIAFAMWSLVNAVRRSSAVWHGLLGVALGACLQIHLSSLALIAIALALAAVYTQKKWMVALIVAGLAVGYAPVIAYDATHNAANFRALLGLPSSHADGEPSLAHIAKTIWNFANVLSGQGLWVSKLSKQQHFPLVLDWGQGLLMTGLFVVALAAMLGRIARTASRARRLRVDFADAVVLSLALAPFAYLLVSQSQIQRHYFVALYPAAFLLLARGLSLVWDARRKLRPALAAAVAATFALNALTLVVAQRFIEQTGGQSVYGTLLEDKRAAVAHIRASSPTGYDVDLRGAQDALPWQFLFRLRDDIEIEGRAEDATALRLARAASPRSFRIVEPEFHPLTLETSERVSFKSRGVVVVERQ